MSQSASFPPPYSPTVGSVEPTMRIAESSTFTPPDKLSSSLPKEGGSCPQLNIALPALTGGETLSTIAREGGIQPTEAELQAFLHKEPLPSGKSLAAGLALLAAAPLSSGPIQ